MINRSAHSSELPLGAGSEGAQLTPRNIGFTHRRFAARHSRLAVEIFEQKTVALGTCSARLAARSARREAIPLSAMGPTPGTVEVCA
jgi:hypothetical protein